MASIVSIKGTIVWYPQLLAIQMIGGVCLASNFWKLNKFLAIFLSYLVFSYIYVCSASPRSLMCLSIGLLAISVTLIVSKLKDLKYIYWALIGMSLLSIAYAILQAFGHDPIFVPLRSGKEDVVSFMGSHNQLGIYSAASAFWSPWLIPLAIVPIFLAKCNSALIGLFAGSMVYIWARYGKKVFSIVILLVLCLSPVWWHFNHKSNTELQERFKIWKLTTDQIVSGKIDSYDFNGKHYLVQDSQWTGFGLGNFFVYSPMSQFKIWGLDKTEVYTPITLPRGIQHFYEHAHDDLLEALYEFGYIGFFLVLALIVSVVVVFIRSIKTLGVILTFSSLVAQSVASLSVYVFHAPVSLFMFCLVLGLFYAEVNLSAKPSQV